MTLTFFFAANPSYFLVLVGLVGLLVGSFLNVVVYRLPLMLERAWKAQSESADATPESDAAFNLAVPRSQCPSCQHQLSAAENIPVVSYLFLRARCRHCRVRIAPRYPLVELAAALASVLVAREFGFTPTTLFLLIFVYALIAASLIDFDHQLIPDDISLPLLWLGLLVAAFDCGVPGVSAFDAIVGATVGYLSLWLLYWVFLLATGKEGLGYGDFKLLAALGAWLGWQNLPAILLLSSLVGAVIGLGLITLGGRTRNQPMPFGPFLAGAGFVMLLWGPQLTDFYLSLLTP